MTEQRAIQYNELGNPDVLHVSTVAVPTPGDERALLAVRAVGINPYDAKVRSGAAPSDKPFPRGIGADVAGEVIAVGAGAAYADGSAVSVGDLVYGWGLNTLRERLIVRAASITRVPDGLPVEVAGSLATPGLTALSCLDAVPVSSSDTVLVSSGSGSVGFLIAQLAMRAGARVIGTTGAAGEQRLREAGITPVRYGEGLTERVRELISGDLTAVFDTAGAETIRTGLDLGAAPSRICTIAGVEDEFGVVAPSSPRSITALASLGSLIAAGDVNLPVSATFPLDEVVQAFELLETGHPGGKVVVTPA